MTLKSESFLGLTLLVPLMKWLYTKCNRRRCSKSWLCRAFLLPFSEYIANVDYESFDLLLLLRGYRYKCSGWFVVICNVICIITNAIWLCTVPWFLFKAVLGSNKCFNNVGTCFHGSGFEVRLVALDGSCLLRLLGISCSWGEGLAHDYAFSKRFNGLTHPCILAYVLSNFLSSHGRLDMVANDLLQALTNLTQISFTRGSRYTVELLTDLWIHVPDIWKSGPDYRFDIISNYFFSCSCDELICISFKGPTLHSLVLHSPKGCVSSYPFSLIWYIIARDEFVPHHLPQDAFRPEDCDVGRVAEDEIVTCHQKTWCVGLENVWKEWLSYNPVCWCASLVQMTTCRTNQIFPLL